MELISVEQQEDLVHRVSLPNPCSYAHGFREKVGRRAKAQGAHGVFALLAATRPRELELIHIPQRNQGRAGLG